METKPLPPHSLVSKMKCLNVPRILRRTYISCLRDVYTKVRTSIPGRIFMSVKCVTAMGTVTAVLKFILGHG
jgi:hypothetical protein